MKTRATHHCSVLLLLAAGSFSLTANAASPDCAPLGHLPGYHAYSGEADGAAEQRDFEAHSFPRADAEAIEIKGRFCNAHYLLDDGKPEPATTEIVRYYQQAFAKLGARILFQDQCTISAMLAKNGSETWMHANCGQGFAGEYFVTVVEKAGLALSLTAPAADDYRLLGHMPGYGVVKTDKKDAGQALVPLGEKQPAVVQGKSLRLVYQPKDRQAASDLEVMENYAKAIRALNGEVLWQGKNDITTRFDDHGQQVWVRVNNLFNDITVDVVEEKPFVASVEPPKPDAMKAALDKDGHIALYVNFDFAKATLKPDAAAVIAQVVALLKANPAYKLNIQGHTDSVGDNDANQKLSEARAANVLDAVVKGGIDKARLTSGGSGESSPIADNRTSEGRAKNRRVELVKR